MNVTCQDTIGGISWNNEESQVVYVAEVNRIENNFEFQSDFGEGFDSKKQSVLVIVDFERNKHNYNAIQVIDLKVTLGDVILLFTTLQLIQ